MGDEVVEWDLVSSEEVTDRLPYEIYDPQVVKMVAGVIVDASNLARHYGSHAWHSTLVPPVVKTQVRNACVRAVLLADGVVQSRAGDESEMQTDLREKTGTVFFTDEEIATLREAAGSGGNFRGVGTFRFSTHSVTAPLAHRRLVPFQEGNPFPVPDSGFGL